MKKINHLLEVIIGFLISLPSIFIKKIIEIIYSWNNLFIWKYLFIIFFRILDLFFLLVGLLVLIDGIQGLFTEESIIPKLKETLFG